MQRLSPCPLAGFWLATLASPKPSFATEELIDGIAAQVGAQIVLVSEVMAKVADTETRMIEAGAPQTEVFRLRADGLERMIEQKILESEVLRLELRASEAEIDQVVSVLAAENGITLGQLADSVRSQGMTMDEYRGEIRSKVEQRKVMTQALQPKVIVEEQEVRQLYTDRFRDQPQGGMQIHLRHLLIEVKPDRDIESACTQAKAAAARIRGGESFELVAGEVSAVSPENGGDVGWVHSDSLASWMLDLTAELKPGEMSGVSRQPFGCNILKLVERTRYEPVTYDQARASLEQMLYSEKMEAEYTIWMEELREHTYIKRRGYFANAANFDPIEPETESSDSDIGQSLFQ
jgi:parvulin-like peptidyl-prolyl isomerase